MDRAAPLPHWLRLLWGRVPPLHDGAEQPFITDGAIHLPAAPHWRAQRAAAAHAAAHLVFSPPRFDGQGLAPLARALLALLEDARVELLAGRELPGLLRLWRARHAAVATAGVDCESLLRRLARALIDPAHADPHPWVRKGRELFFLDAGLALAALRTPAELRMVATRLGHDLGQMRLPFDGRNYRPAPDYRDDHRWMWAAEGRREAAPMPPPEPCAAAPAVEASEVLQLTHQPEWDQRIARLRPGWCTVREERLPRSPAPGRADGSTQRLAARLGPALRRLASEPAAALDFEGLAFDLDAVQRWRIEHRIGLTPMPKVYRQPRRRPQRPSVWLLVDRSASTATLLGPAGPSVVQAASNAATAIVLALSRQRAACAVSAFDSNGRHAVRLLTAWRFESAPDVAALAALRHLPAAGSTRLGAVLRHAAAGLAVRPRGPRWILLLSDAEPHDVDVHEPRYLEADARRALREAQRRSVRSACLAFGPGSEAGARRLFGRSVQPVTRIDALPRALQRLFA